MFLVTSSYREIGTENEQQKIYILPHGLETYPTFMSSTGTFDLIFFITLSDFLEFWIAKGFCRKFVLIWTFSFFEYLIKVLCAAFNKVFNKVFSIELWLKSVFKRNRLKIAFNRNELQINRKVLRLNNFWLKLRVTK